MKANKKKIAGVIIAIAIVIYISVCFINKKKFSSEWIPTQYSDTSNSTFELKKGDILIRPNWMWWPGSMGIPNGRRYGHVGVVVEGATSNSIEETLQKARIIEALFFDQRTKQFVFNSAEQLREESAVVSFGSKFKGIRYRLRMPQTQEETDSICNFLRSQLNARYNIFSLKSKQKINSQLGTTSVGRDSWHCATLTWTAFYTFKNIDIDGNGGILIYPSDIIGSTLFDSEGSRICF
jgi:hypothetical protein